jgi:16S rRNA (cytidine1402-2'-O)-methyltransferase
VPIGNADDITLRALDTLREVDIVICEEYKTAIRMLKTYGLEKNLLELNEHSKRADIRQLLDDHLIKKKKTVALISEAGTPAFADPGAELVQLCHDYGVPVYAVPGASSLMAAISLSGIKDSRFLYYGFLPAKREDRVSALKQLKTIAQYDIVFMEAPYRLKSLVPDMISVLGRKRKVKLFYKLTQPEQSIFTGTLEELNAATESYPKGEFVLILEHESKY